MAKLIEQEKGLEERREQLETVKTYWVKRTAKAVMAMLDPPPSSGPQYISVGFGDGRIRMVGIEEDPDDPNRVDDASIVRHAARVKELQDACDKLAKEIDDLKGQDVVGKLKKLLEAPEPKP